MEPVPRFPGTRLELNQRPFALWDDVQPAEPARQGRVGAILNSHLLRLSAFKVLTLAETHLSVSGQDFTTGPHVAVDMLAPRLSSPAKPVRAVQTSAFRFHLRLCPGIFLPLLHV